jgi:hypothetical protein
VSTATLIEIVYVASIEAEEEVLVVVASATVVELWNWWVCYFYFSSTSLGYYWLCVQKKQLDGFF